LAALSADEQRYLDGILARLAAQAEAL